MNVKLLRSFRYFPPLIKNHLLYLTMLVIFLIWLHTDGQMVWQSIAESYTIFQFFVIGGFGFYFCFFWLLSAFYLHLYYKKSPSWLYKYKIQDHPDDKPGHTVDIKKSIGLVLFNQIFGTLPYLILVVYVLQWRGYDPSYLSPWWVNICHIIVMILCQDFFFYLNHLWMHKNKWAYKNFHSIHHDYRETIAIATHHVHPVEHFIGNLFPVFIGAMIVLPHPFVFMFWIVLIVINALHNHSGFAFPYMSYSVHHDWHHFYFNSSYSSIGLCDKIFGTDGPFEEMIELKK